MKTDWEKLEPLVHGGMILGGGGGGSRAEGLRAARLALELGSPRIVALEEIDPDSWVITVSAVGAPAAMDQFVRPMDYVESLRRVIDELDGKVAGIIQNEMGGNASGNGFVQSAVLNLPVIDAPCNGRAHPLAVMGSLGLQRKTDYAAIQAACGGDPSRGRRVDLLVKGDINRCSALVREASIQAGGVVAVARNPVKASWLEKNAAVGAMKATIELGRMYLKSSRAGGDTAQTVADQLGGIVACRGVATEVKLRTQDGFDVGHLVMEGGENLVFWNEYMLLEIDGERRATFPDLITTFNAATGEPVNTADLAEGMDIAVVTIPRDRLILGQGMRDRELFSRVEDVVKRPILKFAFEDTHAA